MAKKAHVSKLIVTLTRPRQVKLSKRNYCIFKLVLKFTFRFLFPGEYHTFAFYFLLNTTSRWYPCFEIERGKYKTMGSFIISDYLEALKISRKSRNALTGGVYACFVIYSHKYMFFHQATFIFNRTNRHARWHSLTWYQHALYVGYI